MDAIFSKILGQFLIVHLLHNVPLNDNQEKKEGTNDMCNY